MTRGKKLKQMLRFLNKNGKIYSEIKRPPDPDFQPYRKGSVLVVYRCEVTDESFCVGDVNRYAAYKSIYNHVKKSIKKGKE